MEGFAQGIGFLVLAVAAVAVACVAAAALFMLFIGLPMHLWFKFEDWRDLRRVLKHPAGPDSRAS